MPTVQSRIPEVLAEAEARLSGRLGDFGRVLTGEVKATMLSSAPRGRLYRRRGVLHRASAPGQPPAIDTGRYLRSIRWEVVKLGPGRYRLLAGSSLPGRGRWLEYGTPRMAPRPHWRIAWMRTRGLRQELVR